MSARSQADTSFANLANSRVCVSSSVLQRLTISSRVFPRRSEGAGTDGTAAGPPAVALVPAAGVVPAAAGVAPKSGFVVELVDAPGAAGAAPPNRGFVPRPAAGAGVVPVAGFAASAGFAPKRFRVAKGIERTFTIAYDSDSRVVPAAEGVLDAASFEVAADASPNSPPAGVAVVFAGVEPKRLGAAATRSSLSVEVA